MKTTSNHPARSTHESTVREMQRAGRAHFSDPTTNLYPQPRSIVQEPVLETHLVSLGLIFYPNHCFPYGMDQLLHNPRFMQFKRACLYQGCLLSRHPALHGGNTEATKELRKKRADSLFPLDITWEQQSYLDIRSMYDIIASRLLYCQSKFFIKDINVGTEAFLQSVHICRAFRVLDVPDNLQSLDHDGIERVAIQLSLIYRVLVIDTFFSVSHRKPYVIDDAHLVKHLTFAEVQQRMMNKPQLPAKKPEDHDYSRMHRSSIPNLEIYVFFIKFTRQCLMLPKRAPSPTPQELQTLHFLIMAVMLASNDSDFKRLSPSVWNQPVQQLYPFQVTVLNNQNLASIMQLIFVHSSSVSAETLFPVEKNGPVQFRSADILFGALHALGRICYFFLQPENQLSSIEEPYSNHLPPLSIATGAYTFMIFLACQQCLNALFQSSLFRERIDSIVALVKENIVPCLRYLGQTWDLADFCADRLMDLLGNLLSFMRQAK
ncbi:hypothetical protein HDV03_002007 [Kappamyces sp. JEL0829]|nr:hypothetical protein HDV03_002007 [Kappamyces sp. JEL0829]